MATTLPVIKVVTKPERPQYAEVYINDVFIPGVRAVNIDTSVDDMPTVTLQITCKLELAKPAEGLNEAE